MKTKRHRKRGYEEIKGLIWEKIIGSEIKCTNGARLNEKQETGSYFISKVQ